MLDDFHVYVQPINYPTVPRGQERLRITASPQHTARMIKKLVTALCAVYKNFEINRELLKSQDIDKVELSKSEPAHRDAHVPVPAP